MLNLALHRSAKENDKVHDQNRPEHGHVKRLEKGEEKAEEDGSGRREPKLELWKPADEGTEFLARLRRERRPIVFVFVEVIARNSPVRVHFGRQKGDEHVEDVDTESVGN